MNRVYLVQNFEWTESPCHMIAHGTTCHNITGVRDQSLWNGHSDDPAFCYEIRESDEYGAECPRNQELLRIRPLPHNAEMSAGVILPPAVNADGTCLASSRSEMECALQKLLPSITYVVLLAVRCVLAKYCTTKGQTAFWKTPSDQVIFDLHFIPTLGSAPLRDRDSAASSVLTFLAGPTLHCGWENAGTKMSSRYGVHEACGV